MKKNKVEEKEIEMHQHIDENKVPFGKIHHIDLEHKKESTKKAHNNSIEFSKKINDIHRKIK